METWPLWMCLKPKDLARLIQYQWENYGLKLELRLKTDIESTQEIEVLMRQTKRDF